MPNRNSFRRMFLEKTKKEFSIPYLLDASEFDNGPLPSPWVGNTFSFQDFKIINNPNVGPNLIGIAAGGDPSLESEYTNGRNGYIGPSGLEVLSESADSHSGDKAQQVLPTAQNSYTFFSWPPVLGIPGNWYRWRVWVKRAIGTNKNSLTRMWQSDGFPHSGGLTQQRILSDVYNENKHVLIATSGERIFPYGSYESGSSDFNTILMDDGTLEVLEYSTLFAMCNEPIPRLSTVKVKFSETEDGCLSFLVAWANSAISPNTYLCAWWQDYPADEYIVVGLFKCVNGVYTILVDEYGTPQYDDAWLEIRPIDTNNVGLFFNNSQIGSNVEVLDVLGSYSGIGITGGNNIKSFFVG